MNLIPFLADSVAGGEASLTVQAIIATSLGGLGYFGKKYLDGLAEKIESQTSEMKTARIAVDLNTRAVTMAVLGISALIPGSKPILEDAKASADSRLKSEGL